MWLIKIIPEVYSFKHTSHVFVFIIFCNLFDIANHLSLMRKKYFLLFCLVDASLTMKFFHISSIVLVPWSSCLGGYSSVPDDYPLVLGCEEHVSSLGVFVA